MVIVPLPKPPELEKLLGALLMRPVKAARLESETAPVGPLVTSLFASEDPVLQVLVRAELKLAASLAAALSVVPLTAVKEAIKAGKMDESLQDNCAEVMNVLSRFISGGGRPFRLGHSTYPPAVPDAALTAAVAASDEKRQLKIEVPGYDAGLLEFITL
jgi:hypothetical protein